MADIDISLGILGDNIVIGAFRRIGEVAIDALGSAFSAVADFAVDSFKGAIEAQEGIDKLTGSIARLGDKSPITIDGAMALADQFKNLVGGSDDVVLAMTNVGLRFDKIGADILPRFIEQSADLATTLKLEPTKAAELLGKVLQDLGADGVGSIGKLKAAGIQLTDEQEKQIQKLVELGDVTGAQTVLMDALAATTGGAAANASNTLAGRMAIFNETIADAGEGVMLALLPGLTDLAEAVMPVVIDVVTKAAYAFTKISEAISWAIGYLVGGGSLNDALLGLKDFSWDDMFGPEVGKIIYDTINVLIGLTNYVTSTLIPAFMSAVDWVKVNWPAVQQAIIDGWNAAQPALIALKDFILNTVVPAIQQAVAWVVEHWPEIQAKIQEVWNNVQPVLQAVWDFIQTVVIPAFQSAVAWVIENWPTIYATIQSVMTDVQNVINTVLTWVQDFWAEWGDEIVAAGEAIWKLVSDVFAAFAKAFKGDWRGFGEDLRKAFDEAWVKIQAIVTTAIDAILKMDWGKIGNDIIQGIANGITAAAHFIVEAATAAAQAAVAAVKGFLGIESPSKVFAGIGKNMMMGMSGGILDNAASPIGAVRSVSGSLVGAATTNNNGGNTYNYYGVQADMQYAYTRAVAGAY